MKIPLITFLTVVLLSIYSCSKSGEPPALEGVWLEEGAFPTSVGSKEEADRISIENKPIRGTIDLHIRTRNWEINSEMIKDLKAKNLISDYRMGDNADDIFHWKDDR